MMMMLMTIWTWNS